MRTRRGANVLVALAALATGACGGSDEAAELDAVRTAPFRMMGAFQGETYLMVPCTDSDAGIEIVFDPMGLDLGAMHAELIPGLQEKEMIFLDLFGTAEEDGDEVTFDVIDVYRAAWEDWECTWRPYVQPMLLSMTGSEGGWELQLGGDSTVAFYRPAEGMVSGAWAELEGSLASGWTSAGQIEGEPWTLELFQQACWNQATGAMSHLTGALAWRNETWTACGFMGAIEEVS